MQSFWAPHLTIWACINNFKVIMYKLIIKFKRAGNWDDELYHARTRTFESVTPVQSDSESESSDYIVVDQSNPDIPSTPEFGQPSLGGIPISKFRPRNPDSEFGPNRPTSSMTLSNSLRAGSTVPVTPRGSHDRSHTPEPRTPRESDTYSLNGADMNLNSEPFRLRVRGSHKKSHTPEIGLNSRGSDTNRPDTFTSDPVTSRNNDNNGPRSSFSGRLSSRGPDKVITSKQTWSDPSDYFDDSVTFSNGPGPGRGPRPAYPSYCNSNNNDTPIRSDVNDRRTTNGTECLQGTLKVLGEGCGALCALGSVKCIESVSMGSEKCIKSAKRLKNFLLHGRRIQHVDKHFIDPGYNGRRIQHVDKHFIDPGYIPQNHSTGCRQSNVETVPRAKGIIRQG